MRLILGILVTICGLAAAQTPQFEVASIKPSAPDQTAGRMSGGPGTSDPGLFTCQNITLTALVRTAYDLPNYRYSGPDWMGSVRFDISAKIPEGTTKAQFRAMLQNLFIERVKLSTHWQKKEIGTLDLEVGKRSHHLKESISPATQARHNVLTEESGNVVMHSVDTTMDQLAIYLSAQLRKPVNNVTGLEGRFDFTLSWSTGDDLGATLMQAVPDQLGLRLEPRKGTVDVLVVDHVDKTPTDN